MVWGRMAGPMPASIRDTLRTASCQLTGSNAACPAMPTRIATSTIASAIPRWRAIRSKKSRVGSTASLFDSYMYPLTVLLQVLRQTGSQTDITAWRQRQQALSGVLGQLQPLYEFCQRFPGDALAPRERLELFVGFRQPVATHHRLYRFGQHFPAIVQICVDRLGVELELAQTTHARGIGNGTITQRDPEVAQYGRVGQVTLPAGNGQLFRQVTQYGIGKPQVAFGVFEVDRVDFMRHGGRTDLAFVETLSEISQSNIAPDIPIEVDQNGIGPRDCVKQLGHPVM